MTAIVDTREQADALELPPLLVRRPLERFLDDNGLGSGPLEAEPLGDGHSNVTYLVRRDDEEFVVRRPPRPPLPPSAHDVLREARLLRALAGTPVRVPNVLAVCDDERVIGAPFYVMERLDGHVLTGSIPDELDGEADRRRIGEELIDALVEVHAVDIDAVGLDTFGRRTGYLDRQLRRFSGLWEINKTREVPELDRLTAWLAEHKPESGPATIVHGDYRLGNTMFGPDAPAELVAIFDWELATIGDPLADVGYLTATWSEAGDAPGSVMSLSALTAQPGFLTRAELIARYEAGSGRSVSSVNWYGALALWKSAVFLEGSYKRRLAGTTDDPFFDLLGEGVPRLVEQAWAVAESLI